jgi:hypothetical protein
VGGSFLVAKLSYYFAAVQNKKVRVVGTTGTTATNEELPLDFVFYVDSSFTNINDGNTVAPAATCSILFSSLLDLRCRRQKDVGASEALREHARCMRIHDAWTYAATRAAHAVVRAARAAKALRERASLALHCHLYCR